MWRIAQHGFSQQEVLIMAAMNAASRNQSGLRTLAKTVAAMNSKQNPCNLMLRKLNDR